MSKSIRRLTGFATIGAAAALLMLPAAGQAATIFGNPLRDNPNDTTCKMFGVCTLVAFVDPPMDPEGAPTSAGAPTDGVITKFRIRAYALEEPGQVTFRVVDISLPDPNDKDNALASASGSGPTITIQPDEDAIETPITEVDGHLPVKRGQHLAIDASASIAAVHSSNSDQYTYLFAPPLVQGAGPRGSNEVLNEMLVQATIEPDADNDGFGDETQDQCPTQAATQGPCDLAAPGVTGLKVSNGKKVSYTLSEAATVQLKIEKKSKGRKVGKKCAKQTKGNKKKKACARFTPVGGTFTGPGNAGANQASIPRKLSPGTYRLTMTARDAVGNVSTKTTTFKVAAPKKGKKKK